VLNNERISFKKLQVEDLQLMHKWLNQPLVKEWYGRNEDSRLEAVRKRYIPRIKGEESTDCYIVYYENIQLPSYKPIS
jgi:hypothetical protein